MMMMILFCFACMYRWIKETSKIKRVMIWRFYVDLASGSIAITAYLADIRGVIRMDKCFYDEMKDRWLTGSCI